MKEKSKIVKISGIVVGVLFLLTIVASILIRNLSLPVGLFLFLNGLFLLVLSIIAGKKKSSGQEDNYIQLIILDS